VILVDYRRAASEYYYVQSVANARVVGVQIANVLRIARDWHNISLEDVHIVGHSLGAHVAGYAGKLLDGIGRITGTEH